MRLSRHSAEAAAKVLRELGYNNVSVKVGDGYQGWPECGPFDAIIVTAALGHVPPPLIEQLKVGGRLVMPLGPADAPQQLTVIEKVAPNETRMRSIILVHFVALYPVPGLNANNIEGGMGQDGKGTQACGLMRGSGRERARTKQMPRRQGRKFLGAVCARTASGPKGHFAQRRRVKAYLSPC